MNEQQLQAVVGLVAGLEVAVIHIFNSLHKREILPRQEAIASLQQTITQLPSDVPQQVEMVLRHLIAGLQTSEGMQGHPPPDIRHLLKVIKGGLDDADSTPTPQA